MSNKVTLEQIQAKIKNVTFHMVTITKTIAVLTLENGYTVTGESDCVDPSTFDEDIGKNEAYKKAVNNVWELEGYLLKEKIHQRMPQGIGVSIDMGVLIDPIIKDIMDSMVCMDFSPAKPVPVTAKPKMIYMFGDTRRKEVIDGRIKDIDNPNTYFIGEITFITEKVKDDLIRYQIAFCSPDDQFDKHKGIEIAKKKPYHYCDISSNWNHYEIKMALAQSLLLDATVSGISVGIPGKNWWKIILTEVINECSCILLNKY